MFQKGEFVIYGSKGVCEITDISTIDISGMNREKLYYFLRPVNDQDGKIFIPVDSDKIRMRRILTREEAQELVDSIPQIGYLWIADEKQREACYRQAVNDCDCREWIRILKTLWKRNRERSARGKKETAMDRKYFRIAQDNLYTELAVSLKIGPEEVKEYIAGRVESREKEEPEAVPV
ncbi:MAG TPA: CarD family transcriptional regulator [Candidatus Eisenbergiella intestinipullorum]|nr:CarD family transcriptional regulator [Candidatus Eisenbergiella intestinipullorum]